MRDPAATIENMGRFGTEYLYDKFDLQYETIYTTSLDTSITEMRGIYQYSPSSLRAGLARDNYRRKADSIFAKALICPFCTFFG
jgi:hypothetical protein